MKNKILILFVIMITVIIIFQCNVNANNEGEKRYISNAEELKQFAQEVNSGTTFEGIDVELTKDINLNCDEENQWIPIGNCAVEFGNIAATTDKKNPFKGHFNRK